MHIIPQCTRATAKLLVNNPFKARSQVHLYDRICSVGSVLTWCVSYAVQKSKDVLKICSMARVLLDRKVVLPSRPGHICGANIDDPVV